MHGVLRVGSYEDLDSLNPIISNETFVNDVAQMLYSGLIDYDDHGSAIPDIAVLVPTQENGGISADGKTITYHLRKGVVFSDGVPLTSADVKFTWQQIMNPNNNVPYRYPYDQVRAIDTLDAYTVVVHLRHPQASFVPYFMRNGTQGSIVPKHLLDKYSDLNKIPFNTHPVGSGPFIVSRWEPGVALTLEANRSYWRGSPKLREIQYRIITNQNSLLADTLGHDIDFYYLAPEAQYSTLRSLQGYAVHAVPNMTYEQVVFNCARPPLNDVRVRQAIAYAIDWRNLADSVYFGVDRPGMADTPPMLWAYDPSVTPYPHDVVRARALLKEAGWVPDSAGVLSREGQPFQITIVTVSGITTRQKAQVLIQENLRTVGIQLEIHNYPANLLFGPYAGGGVLANGRFDLAIFAWPYLVPDPDDSITVGPGAIPPAGDNYSFYADPQIGVWQQAGQLHYNRAQRRPYYVQIQRRIHSAVPFHTIVWRSNIDAVNSDLRNFKPAPVVSDFWNSWEWQI